MDGMEVEVLKGSSARLVEIKKLWRAHAATLGFFPDGAFQEYASKGCILVASDPLGQLAGYLLFRKSGDRLAIVHLCVRENMQGRGVAKTLVDALLVMSKSFLGINVSCRRDFSASSLWPKLGFMAVQEKPGRGRKNTILTNWWLDRGTPDLFSSPEQVDAEKKLKIVIDANVFYDLDNPVAPDTEESKALQADWLQSSIELQITPETLNEINRHNTSSHRLRNRNRTARFTVLRPQHDRFSSIERKVRKFFRAPLSESDESDVRQLAWAIASGQSIFVTRDENLLDLASQLYREFAISLMRPSDFIIQLDELHEHSKYQPARVAGTLALQRLRKAPTDDLVRALQASERKETKPKFRERFCKYLAAPQSCHCWGLFWEKEKPAALFVYDRTSKEELLVPFLRITRGSEAFTILRNLLLRLVQDAATENRTRIVITDPFCLEFVEQELEQDGFNREGRYWVKHTIPSAVTAERFIEKHSSILESGGRGGEHEVMQSFSEIIRSDARTAQKLERAYWPLKIVDAPIPNYIIPIQPRWAAELFDNELANQDLFGARTKLSLNREGVYYRSAMPTGGLTAPGRILWYVSDDKKYQGSKCIRACSFLEDVVVGRPKELFRRFDRLGVYEWKHLMALTKDNIDKNLMTVRYSDTQLMANPIIWDDFQAVLQESGVRTQLQSPQQISSQVFAKLYRMGMGYKDNL
jgi:predicted nucleic acid-binding protein/GNAT superfamily N-acetyltransferase